MHVFRVRVHPVNIDHGTFILGHLLRVMYVYVYVCT